MAVAEGSMQQQYLRALRSVIPPLTHSSHKGTAGRIGVIGGSLEYTGAPYFAAISAMRAGADLGHVFCPEAAAPVIKSYSPELIVHPILSGQCSESTDAIREWLPRLHALVVGPGLGRDPAILKTVRSVIDAAKEQEKDIVIDADGLFLVTSDPDTVTGYKRVVLTPNQVEFQRLYEKMLGSEPSAAGDLAEQTKALAASLGNLVVVRKGQVDTISDGIEVVQCSEKGSPRRCGGQGDLLSGTVGLFAHWARTAEQQLAASYGVSPLLLASYGGCFLVKKCAELALNKYHRSLLSGDMLLEITTVFQTVLESSHDT